MQYYFSGIKAGSIGKTFSKFFNFSIAFQKQILKQMGNLTLNISEPLKLCYQIDMGRFSRMNEGQPF